MGEHRGRVIGTYAWVHEVSDLIPRVENKIFFKGVVKSLVQVVHKSPKPPNQFSNHTLVVITIFDFLTCERASLCVVC